MSGESAAARLLLDEDIRRRLAPLLRQHHIDAVHVGELHRYGLSDEEQLAFAAAEGRMLVTHNRDDFLRLAAEWWAENRDHAGIVYARQAPIGELLRRLLAMLEQIDAATLRGAVVPLEAFG